MATNIRSISVAGLLVQNGNGTPIHLSPKGSIFVDVDIPCEYLSNGDGTWINIASSNSGSTSSGYTLTANQYAAITGSSSPSSINVFATINDLSSFSGNSDTRITGFTYNNNLLSITNSTGGTLSTIINTMTGLTVNGIFSATTISGGTLYGNGSNLTGISSQDTFVTGATYSAGTAIFTNNTGGTFSVSGFSTGSTLSNTQIGYGSTGNTLTGSTGLTYDVLTNTMNIGPTTPFSFASNFFITNKGIQPRVGIAVANTTPTGATIFNFGESDNNRFSFAKYGSTFASNYVGTTIPFANTSLLTGVSGGTLGAGGVIINGSPIYGLVSNTGTNKGFRMDATGFRIGAINTLQTTNTVPFSVDGTLTYGSNALQNIISTNGEVSTRVTNANAGVGAYAQTYSSNGTVIYSLAQFGTNYTTSGLFQANTSLLQSSSSIGQIFYNTITGSTFIWAIGPNSGSSVNMVLGSTGLTINSLTGVTTQMVVANTLGQLSVRPISADITGLTYNNANQLTVTNNTGGTMNTIINTMTGLTVNGGLTANTVTINQINGLTATTAQTIDLFTSDHFSFTLSGNTTFNLSGNTNGKSWVIGVNSNPVTSGYTSTFSSSPIIKWAYGITPVQTATANKTDIYTFVQLNGNIYGDYSQSY